MERSVDLDKLKSEVQLLQNESVTNNKKLRQLEWDLIILLMMSLLYTGKCVIIGNYMNSIAFYHKGQL